MIRRAQSKLPSGGPSKRGLPLDGAVPGTSTFAKPSEEPARDFDDEGGGSIYRVDDPDDLLTDGSSLGVKEDNAEADSGYAPAGPWDSSGKTKYPYRDGLRHTHNAAAYVLSAWQSSTAPVRRIYAGVPVKIALNMGGIARGLNPKVKKRSRDCEVKLKRADLKNLRWLLAVDCGNGPWMVRVKAVRKGNLSALSKMDLDITCACPFWRWQGSEHHAQREEYIDGQPRGTASVPVIRDPAGINRVCKHVYLVLKLIREWSAPLRARPKTKIKRKRR